MHHQRRVNGGSGAHTMRCEKAREVKATLLSGDKIVLTDRRVFPVSIGGLLVRSMATASNRSGFRAESRACYSGTFATLDEDGLTRLASMSTISNVNPQHSKVSATRGIWPSWVTTSPASVWKSPSGRLERPKRSRNSSRAMRPSRSHDPSRALHGVRLLLALGLHRHVADNRLENVAQGHQPQDGPEFIEDHGDSAG